MNATAERLTREQRAAFMRAQREPVIKAAALACAKRLGFKSVTRDDIAKQARVSPGLVTHYLGTMDDVRNYVMREAVDREELALVRQGIADGHPVAADAPPHVREAAIRST